MEILLKLEELIPPKPFPQIISMFSYLFFLWFALFMFTQKSKKSSLYIAGSAFFILAIYVVLTIIMSITNSQILYLKMEKLLWYTAPLPSVLWLHLTFVLRNEDKTLFKQNYNKIIYLFYLCILPFAIIGPNTNWLYNYDAPSLAFQPFSKWSLYQRIPGPYYYFFVMFLMISTSLAAYNFMLALSRTSCASAKYNKYKWLLRGTLFFVLGATFLSTSIFLMMPLPEAVGHIPLAIGILIVTYSIAKYNALIEGRVIKEKFLSRFWTVFSVIGAFIAIYLVLLPQASIIALLVITTFLLIVLTFYENIIDLWEKLFVDKRITQVKKQTKQMVSQLIEINPDEIGSWVEKVKKLSKAELVIMDSIGKGFGRRTSEDVSQELFLSVKTVNTHLKNIRKKLDCRKSSELPLIWLVVNTIENKPESVNLAALATDTPIAES